MILYQRDTNDKINSINRCFFDAEHGWITLSMDRLQDLHQEFPNDPQVQYAEGLIRKDFLGQGIHAEDLFLAAHKNAKDTSKTNENYLFSTFNSAKYARNLDEYRRQERISRTLDPNDRDLTLFDQINQSLTQGDNYSNILAYAAGEYQQHRKYGDCAAFAEIALQSGTFSLENEIGLRKTRLASLRELDKAAESSRYVRGEGFSPEERLALQQALLEIDEALSLDPEDHMLWNFKSAWLTLIEKPEESIVAADKALSLCPTGYVKPLTNKAIALKKLGRKDEALEIAKKALDNALALGAEGRVDSELAKKIINDLNASLPSDDEMLKAVMERILTSVRIISKQETTQWKGPGQGKYVLKGLNDRLSNIGKTWNERYTSMMAEMLTYFCSETVYLALVNLQDRSRFEEYGHCLHAVLYIAAHEKGVIRRDACRALIYIFLGTDEPRLIRKCYREAIVGSTTVGPNGFSNLDRHMRDELARFNPVLINLIVDDTPLTNNELNWARNVTMARFIDGISRDPIPANRPGAIKSFFRMIFGG